jgi:hypothetical protein
MSHEGRMARGKENYFKGLINNADTQYFLENQEQPKEPKKEKKKNDK